MQIEVIPSVKHSVIIESDEIVWDESKDRSVMQVLLIVFVNEAHIHLFSLLDIVVFTQQGSRYIAKSVYSK